MHIQVIISLIAIAGAAAIALACDFLRARNAQLRDAVKQMKVQKGRQSSGPKPTGPKRTIVKPTPITTDAPLNVPLNAPLAAPEFTTRRGRRRPEPTATAEAPPVKTNPALSAWLIERATARAAGKTAAESETAPVSKESIVIDAHLWAALCNDVPNDAPNGARLQPRQGLELVRGTGPIEVRVPAGMQPSAGLSQLLESSQLFTGLVISIGASLLDARETGQAVDEFIAGLLRTNDFGNRTAEDEFVLICPGLHGAEAQRHLSHVSERLWDYQLRTLGQFSIVFNLGGIDVQRESLSDAVASAKERMKQTRRTRPEPVVQQRKAG